jgi:hypothetical protein
VGRYYRSLWCISVTNEVYSLYMYSICSPPYMQCVAGPPDGPAGAAQAAHRGQVGW